MNTKTQRKRQAFTLIELLVSMAIIGVLSAAVMFALDIPFVMKKGYDAQRQIYVKELGNAMYQNLIDSWHMAGEGAILEGEEHAKPICKKEVPADECQNAFAINLSDLPPEYIAMLPVDPVMDATQRCTGYTIYQQAGRPRVKAPNLGKLPGEEPAPESTCGTVSGGSPEPTCGNSITEAPETCDEGTVLNGQPGHCNLTCTGMEPITTTQCGNTFDDADLEDVLIDCADPGCHTDDNAANPATCDPDDDDEANTARCGNGAVDQVSETCDDGNAVNTDDCLNSCITPTCGDTFIWTGHEQCDPTAFPIGCDGTNTCNVVTCQCESFVVPTCNGEVATVYVNTSNVIVGGPQNGQVYAGTLNGGNGANVIVGTAGADTISGGNNDDLICGGAGDDVINGGNGTDTIFGEEGNDDINGENSVDIICGGPGDDMLYGKGSNDAIDGGSGTDSIDGGNGSGDICRNGETVDDCENTTAAIPECGVAAGG